MSSPESRSQRLKDLEKYLKELQKVIDRQKTVQVQTDLGKTPPMELKDNQNRVTEQTAKD